METYSLGRKDRKREQRRNSLVACARKLFVEKGYTGTTIDDIVDAADVAKVTFYYYFKSKEEIALEMKRQSQEEALKYVEKMRSTDQSAQGMIDVLIKDIVIWTEENWRLLEVFCAQRFSPLVKFENTEECKPEPLTLCVDVIIQRGQDAGEFRSDIDRMRVSHLIDLAILCEQNYWVKSGRKTGELEPRLYKCFDFALNGILVR